MKEFIISNLPEIVKNKEALSAPGCRDKWSAVEYETGEIKGTMLYADYPTRPEPIVLSPNVKGWHKIYLGRMDGCDYIRLSSEETYTFFCNCQNTYRIAKTHQFEYAEEMLWQCADMTGEDIILDKHPKQSYDVALLWIRFVPMTDEEVAAYKEYINPEGHRNLHVHYDNDSNLGEGSEKIEHTRYRLMQVKHDDVKICTQEVTLDHNDTGPHAADEKRLGGTMILYDDENRKLAPKLAEVQKGRLDMLHGWGIKVYAGMRTSIASCVGREPFCATHPEYHIYTRDGRRVNVCSYAYPEVQQHTVDLLKKSMKHGFDGITLICHRGVHLGFEQPVLDEVARRYNGLDARRLPMADERLTSVWCEFFAQFVRRLREQIRMPDGSPVPVNVMIGFSPETAKKNGIDIEKLAAEGLIDHVSQDSMDHYEKVEEYLAEDGLIDLDKYAERVKEYFTVYRDISDYWDQTRGGKTDGTCAGAEKLVAISEKYGIEFFAGITTLHHPTIQHYINWIERLKALGVKNFSCINHCHFRGNQPILRVIGKAGREKLDPESYDLKYHRILKIDGMDISTYMPQWS